MSDRETDSGRRAVLGGAVAAAAVPLVAACAAGNQKAASGPAVPKGSDLGAVSKVPVGGGVVYQTANVVVTQPAKGEFKAFSATCTHMGCQVSSVSNGAIHCPCHGSAFSIKDGSVVSPPARKPLPQEKVNVKNGDIVLG